MNVLVIDDSKVGRMYVERVLELDGHTTIPASNATIAMEELLGNDVRIGAIITDLYMPDMDGDTLIQTYRSKAVKAGNDPSIPAILLTGSQDMNRLDQARTTGFYEIMNKPPDYQRLSELLSEIESGPHIEKKADLLDPFYAMVNEFMNAILHSRDTENAIKLRARMQKAIRDLEDAFPGLK